MSTTADPAGDVTVHQEDGSALTFAPNGSGGYSAPARILATLVANPDGTRTFTRRQRERFVFSGSGTLAKVVDLDGYATTLSYNSSGQLSAVTDSAGLSLSFAWGANSDVANVADPAGRLVRYSYGPAGDLTSVVDVAGGTTSFAYDSAHHLSSMTDPRGATLYNAYDASGRVTAQTDPLGRRATFSYGASGTTIGEPNGSTVAETYTNGVLSSLAKAYGSAQAATWSYAYGDPTLAPSAVTDPDGHTTTYTYDASPTVSQRPLPGETPPTSRPPPRTRRSSTRLRPASPRLERRRALPSSREQHLAASDGPRRDPDKEEATESVRVRTLNTVSDLPPHRNPDQPRPGAAIKTDDASSRSALRTSGAQHP